ncbi:MAG: right-handed parallel beta-helix repeat-containing protein [Phycisphaerales bacterium]
MRTRSAKIVRLGSLCLASIAASAAEAQPSLAADVFVAPDGADDGPGTFEEPFATLERARDAVRAIIADGLSQPVIVAVRGGTYRIEEPLVLGLEDSGTETDRISWVAYPGERPVVSGGRVIDGWAVMPDGTWTTVVPDASAWGFRELFVNGQRRSRARHPNTGFNRIAFAAPDQRHAIEFNEGDLPETTDLSDAELVFLHDWSISRVRIDQVDHASNVLTTAEPIGASAPIFGITFFEDHPRYFVENDAALLDAPGEWFLDTESGTLTYRPLPGESINGSLEVVAPFAEELLVVRGDFEREIPVRGLVFVGIHFEHCAWDLPNGGFAEFQSGFWEWRDTSQPYRFPAAVAFEQVEDCRVERCRFAHLGGWGLMFGRAAVGCVAVGNHIEDVAGNGMVIGEDRFRTVGGVQWWRNHHDQAASRNTIRNNLIERCGREFFGCVGMWVGLANRTEVRQNLLRFLPHSGISVGDIFNQSVSPCFENTIEANHIHHVVQTLSDGGGVYTLGRQGGTMISGNVIHSIPRNAGSGSSVGIFLDQGSTGITAHSNAMHSIARPPFKFHLAGLITVSDNVVVLPDENVAEYQFLSTNPANVTRTGNVFEVADSPVTCDHEIYLVNPSAGLEEPHASRLLGVIVNDGCASCPGVAYSGLERNACGLCNEPLEACDFCPGDCNVDGVVGFDDLVAILFEFGSESINGCDADGSGTIGFGDLIAALFVFGPCA